MTLQPIALNQLHSSLEDPVLDGINFLNEVMDLYPTAISFAPGAPHAETLRGFDPAACIERYREHLRDVDGLAPAAIDKRLYQYGAARGLINDILAGALRIDQQIHARPRDIVVTVGAQEGMLLVLRALCRDPGDLLAVVNPSFIGIRGAARILDIPTLPIPEAADGRGVDAEALAQACIETRSQGRRVRALYVASDFANPSGTRMSLAARQELLRLADAHDFLILEDNAYGFTAEDAAALPTLKALDQRGPLSTGRVVYLGTCAKICLPGLRLGFVVADQPVRRGSGEAGVLAEELATIKSMVTVNTSPLCQAMVAGLILQHGGSLDAVGRSKAALYRRNLRVLLEALDRHLGAEAGTALHWNCPEGGFFVRMQLLVPVTPELVHLSARRHGVLWMPMSGFFLDGGGQNELRLSCSYLDPRQIDQGVQRLAAFLRDPDVGVLPAAAAPTRLAASLEDASRETVALHPDPLSVVDD